LVLYAVERRIVAFLNSNNRIRFLRTLRNVVQHDKYRFLALLEMTWWVGMRIKEQGRNAERDD
jgi:hypothetical protein